MSHKSTQEICHEASKRPILRTEWPPHYTIKRSKRARRMSLKIEAINGLQVVLPVRVAEKHVPPFIEQSRQWIEKHLPAALANPRNESARELPSSVSLRAVDQVWAVDYIQAAGPVRVVCRPHEELILMGDIQNKPACREKLKLWIRKQARVFLIDRARCLSEKISLPFNALSIRDQKTRWGSCCSRKNISLNYKLIFLPEVVVDYVIIHELCHTVHLDHSPRFWALVETFIPDYKQYKKQASQEQYYLPWWLKVL